MLITYWTFF